MSNKDVIEFIDNLKKDYNDYVANVTTPLMSMSFECAAFVIQLVDKYGIDFKNILDMGSGFSSFALRKYAEAFNKNIVITSIDTDKTWLNKTSEFIKIKNLISNNMFNMEEFLSISRIKYDMVFYDIGYYQDGSRQRFLPFLINELIDNSSMVLFDDMHISHYFMFVVDYLSNVCDFNMHNTRLNTQDEFGRFSMLFSNIDLIIKN